MNGAEVRVKRLQSIQTQNLFDLTIAGNTVGVGALVSSGTLTLVGGNNITLSQAGGNAITISGTGGHNVTLAGNSTSAGAGFIQISTGTMTIAGGANITLSQNGNAFSIIGGAGAAGTTFSAGVSTDGNSAGSTGTVSNQIVFVGGTNITLSQSSNVGGSATVTIIGPNTVAQSTQPAVGSLNGSSGTLTIQAGTNITISNNASTISVIGPSNILNSFSIGGNTGTTGSSNITGGGFVIAGGSNVTLSQSNATITIHASQTSNIINEVSILTAGNTAGVMADITSGTLYLAGGNFITLSQNANSITISGPIASRFSAGVTNSGNTAGTTGAFSRYMILVGSNNITLSQSSVAGGSATITILDGGGINAAAGTQTGTTGTVVWSNSNNVSFGMSNSSVITATATFAQSAEPRVISLNGTSGSLSLSGASNITVSALNGSTITIYGPANILNSFSVGGNTGTTGSSAITGGGFIIAGGSNITLSQSNATISIHGISTQSVQPAVGSLNGSSATMSISAGNLISISNNNSTINVINLLSSATIVSSVSSANIVGAMASRFALEGHQHAGMNAGGVTSLGNTAGSTAVLPGVLVLVGSDNITLSQSTSNNNNMTISIIGGAGGGGVVIAAGTQTGNTSGTVIFSNSNNVSFGMSNSSIVTASASFSQSVQTQSTHVHIISGNTAGITASMSTGTIVLAGGNSITLSQNANSVTISGPLFSNSNNITFGSNAGTITASFSQTVPTLSIWDNRIGTGMAVQTSRGIGVFFLGELDPKNGVFPGNMTVSTMYIDVSQSSNVSAQGSGTISLGIYTRNASTLSILNSAATTWNFAANSNNSRALSGRRYITIDASLWSASLSFSQTEYWLGWIYTTGGTSDLKISFLGYSNITIGTGARSGTIGSSITSGNTSMGQQPWIGVGTAVTAALPTDILLGDLSKVDGNAPPQWYPRILFNNISSDW